MKNIRSLAAYSLVEVVIAMAIFSTLMAMVFDGMTASSQVIFRGESKHGLEMEARLIFKDIMNDLNSSAWYLPMDELEKFDLLDPSLDRTLRYYPYVQIQTPQGSGELFTEFHRASSELTSQNDFGNNYFVPDSHRYPSQELIFLKIARSAAKDDPKKVNIDKISFDTNATIAFSDFWNGPIVTEMELVLDGATFDEDDENDDVVLKMERDTSGNLREYSYGIRRNSQTRERELVKYYAHRLDDGQNATSVQSTEMKVLSRNVDRIVFDTYRTQPGMSVDQIRVQVFMSKRTKAGDVLTFQTAITVAMRSTVDPDYSAQIDSWLGRGGDFSVRP